MCKESLNVADLVDGSSIQFANTTESWKPLEEILGGECLTDSLGSKDSRVPKSLLVTNFGRYVFKHCIPMLAFMIKLFSIT